MDVTNDKNASAKLAFFRAECAEDFSAQGFGPCLKVIWWHYAPGLKADWSVSWPLLPVWWARRAVRWVEDLAGK